MKPLTRKSFKQAAIDMLPEIKKLRQEKKRMYVDESWVVGTKELDSIEVRRLNYQLGLDSHSGINQWYDTQYK